MTADKALLILPTLDEASTIEEVIEKSRAAVPGLEILVVDDGSSDGTAELVDAVCASPDAAGVHLLRRGRRKGLGAAYKAGFGWAIARGFDVVIEMDADLQHDPAELPRLLDAVHAGADLAIGSRYLPGGSTPSWALPRRALSRGSNFFAGRLLDLRLSDATSGFRAYRTDLLTTLPFDEAASPGYAFQVEMAHLCRSSGATVVEVPIAFTSRSHGRSKMTPAVALRAALRLLRVGVRFRLGSRRPSGASMPVRGGPGG